MAKKTKINFTTFADIEVEYLSNRSKGMEHELELCRLVLSSQSFTDEEKAEVLLMGAHQWPLNTFKKAITAKGDIIKAFAKEKWWTKSFTSFEEILTTVNHAAKNLPWLGELTCYDVAKRLGWFFSPELLPTDKVYLCAGARKGYKKLFGHTAKIENTKVFKKYFPNLTSLQIEDVLCIMKDAFNNGKVDKTHSYECRKEFCFKLNVNIKLAVKITTTLKPDLMNMGVYDWLKRLFNIV